MKLSSNQGLISVIVSTKNEEKNINNCLQSVLKQTYPKSKVEILVIDNSSSDCTKEYAQRYTQSIYNIGPERSTQRNYGAKKASGDYLLFLDADMILSATVLDCAMKVMMKNSETVALYVPEIVLGKSFWGRVRRFERSFYDGTLIDGLRFFRKETFLFVGGYDESMWACEDWDLDKRIRLTGNTMILSNYDFKELNEKLVYGKQSDDLVSYYSKLTKLPVLYHNEAEFSLKRYLKKKNYYIGNMEKYISKWGRNDNDVRRQFSIKYRYFVVFIEKGKWRTFIRYPLIALALYLLKVLIGLEYVKDGLICKKRT